MPSVRFRLNGAEMEVDADPDRSLLDILRGQLGMTGPHFGCGAGECGACNVIIGDRAVSACDTATTVSYPASRACARKSAIEAPGRSRTAR